MCAKEVFYNPISIKPEYRYVHGDPLLDFDNPVDDRTIEEICNDPYETEFINIEIDVSDDLMDMLLRRTARYLKDRVKPCSWDIWGQKCGEVEDVQDLQTLLGECLINDQLVEAIIAGYQLEHGFRLEPFYTPH